MSDERASTRHPGPPVYLRRGEAMSGRLTLIGSGEASAGMVGLHKRLLSELKTSPRPVFLDTPAGFELGVEAIGRRFQEYFQTSLGAKLAVARYHHRSDPPSVQAEALAAVTGSNYLLAGPGSPTYAVEQWRGTAIFEAMVARWKAGAQWVFASAATVSLSRHALPVYEIYKVGRPLGWTDGLDLLGPFGCELAIVPHWDNAEGGTHDTRACFMGMERFERLLALLPPTAVVLGIDEHTAVSFHPTLGLAEVSGKSGVTVLRGGDERRFASGETFPIDVLHPPRAPDSASRTPGSPPADSPVPGLGAAAARIGSDDLAGGLRALAEAAAPEVGAVLLQAASSAEAVRASDEELGPLIEILIDLRESLRKREEWGLADSLRDRLLALGIELRDTPNGTRWARRPPAADM